MTLNYVNKHVSLEDDPKLQNAVQPSQNLDFILVRP